MKTEKNNSNYLIQGLQPGQLNIITARPSQGKSILFDTVETVKTMEKMKQERKSAINTMTMNEFIRRIK